VRERRAEEIGVGILRILTCEPAHDQFDPYPHPHPSRILVPVTRLTLLISTALTLAGCGGGLPAEPGEEVLLTLLDEPDRMTVRSVERNEPFQVIGAPSGDRRDAQRGNRPVLVVPGRAELVFALPTLPYEASLIVDAGIRVKHYEGSGKAIVTMRAVGGEEGAAPVTLELPSSADLPAEERRWRPARLPLRGASEVQVLITYEGDANRSPNVLLSKLEVRMPAPRQRARASKRYPSVALIVIDTLRADVLGEYGDERDLSPHLDDLARRGTLFERAYSASSWTAPSTASLLTALPPPEHGVSYDSVRDPRGAIPSLAGSFTTLAEAFLREGLHTAGFSANPLATGAYRMDQGFEEFVPYPWSQAVAGPIDDALAWLDQVKGERFFLYVHLVDPHGPYVPDEPFAARFEAEAPAEEERLQTDLLMGDFFRGKVERAALDEAIEYARVKYAGEVASVDAQVGRFLDALAESGLDSSTLVCVTSDHGEEFGDHGLLGHVNQLFDATLRVPLILAGPGVPRAERVPFPVENRRIGRTLLELSRVKQSSSFGDRSIFEREPGDETLFFTTRNGRMRHPRTRRWAPYDQQFGALEGSLLLHWAPASPRYERELVALFDLTTDPRGEQDLARERPEDVARLKQGIEEWIARGVDRRPDGLGGGGGPQLLAELRALGYLGDEEEEDPDAVEPAAEEEEGAPDSGG